MNDTLLATAIFYGLVNFAGALVIWYGLKAWLWVWAKIRPSKQKTPPG